MESIKNNKITIVVPVFNNGKTIGETIESVLAQTYPNWELICVDDGSTDNSLSIIEEYSHKDNRIVLLQRMVLPKGGSTCRNVGAYAATGGYLIFLDGDDLLTETCLENRLKAIIETSYDFVVFPMASFISSKTEYTVFSRLNVKNVKYYFASAEPVWQITSPIIRSSFFKSLNGFDATFPRFQDLEFHFRAVIASKGNYHVSKNSQADCLYRVSNVKNPQKIVVSLKACRIWLDFLNEHLDVLNDKKSLSNALMIFYCSMCIYLYQAKQLNLVDIPEFNEINRPSLLKYLVSFHRLLFRFLYFIRNQKCGYFAARLIRRYYQIVLTNKYSDDK